MCVCVLECEGYLERQRRKTARRRVISRRRESKPNTMYVNSLGM